MNEIHNGDMNLNLLFHVE